MHLVTDFPRWEFHVKHSDSIAALTELCRQATVEVQSDVLDALVSYLEAVLRANRTVNLTRVTDHRDALRLHILDSLCALPEITDASLGRMCDIGTGAGFPGVPIALAAKRECTLLDSVGKKADVAERILAELGMDQGITVSRDRAEYHARAHTGSYSVVTARAVAPIASLVELSAPLLSHGGRLVALKGNPTELEVAAGRAAAAVVGLDFRSRRDYVLPGGEEQRCVIVYEKVRKSTISLPRREGLAQHSPLG